MYLCFVDESGTPARTAEERPRYFVIGGLIVPEERWHSLASRLHGLKVRSRYRGELKWRYFAPNNHKPDNPMAGWDQEKRNKLRGEVFKLLTQDRSLKAVACVSSAPEAYELGIVDNQHDIYFQTYKPLTERFQYFLQDIQRESGRPTMGMIIADHRGRGDDDRMRNQHQRLVETDRQFTSHYQNLVEGLFLTPSHLSVGIQLVDMIAGAIWRRFEQDDPTWFEQIRPVIRQSKLGKIDGYGIVRFPKRGWKGVTI
jgi:extradiol dioxygenase family protein